MKKIRILAVLLIATLILASCKGYVEPVESGESGKNGGIVAAYNAGDIALTNIIIDGASYDKTEEVYATGSNGAKVTGKTETDNWQGVFIQGRTVTLNPFIMSKYQVTQELYEAVMKNQTIGEDALNANPFYCKETEEFPLVSGETQKYRPAENVNWYDAVYFCNALTEKTMTTSDKVYTITDITVSSGHITSATVTADITKKGYRLPTEAEWEFAARGGDPAKPAWDYLFSGATTGKVSTADDAENATYSSNTNTGLDTVGWYLYNTKYGTTGDETPSSGETGYGTHEVGKKTANTLGIFDMSGNVWEWCYDWYGSIELETVTNPTGAAVGTGRVVRGCSWLYNALSASVSYRCNNFVKPGISNCYLGFRVVRSVP